MPDSDEIDLALPPDTKKPTKEQDCQRQRYLERFKQKVVDVTQVTSRLLKMCGHLREKSTAAEHVLKRVSRPSTQATVAR